MNGVLRMLAATVAVAVVSGLIWSKSISSRTPPAAAAAVADVAAAASAARDVEDLRREVSQLKWNQAAQAAALAAASRPVAPTDAAPPPAAPHEDPAQVRAAMKQEIDDYQARLENELSSQKRDAQWASATEQKITDVARDLKPGMLLQKVSCAASLCKVAVQLNSETERRELADLVGAKEPFVGGTFFAHDGLITTMYVAREGGALPSMSEARR